MSSKYLVRLLHLEATSPLGADTITNSWFVRLQPGLTWSATGAITFNWGYSLSFVSLTRYNAQQVAVEVIHLGTHKFIAIIRQICTILDCHNTCVTSMIVNGVGFFISTSNVKTVQFRQMLMYKSEFETIPDYIGKTKQYLGWGQVKQSLKNSTAKYNTEHGHGLLLEKYLPLLLKIIWRVVSRMADGRHQNKTQDLESNDSSSVKLPHYPSRLVVAPYTSVINREH